MFYHLTLPLMSSAHDTDVIFSILCCCIKKKSWSVPLTQFHSARRMRTCGERETQTPVDWKELGESRDRKGCCPVELSVLTETFSSALSNAEATGPMWLLCL